MVAAMQAVATPAAPDPESPTRSRVGYLVYRVERRLRTRLDEALRDHGVTTTEYVTLSVLRQHDGMSGAELARWAFVTPQAMNAVISKLEQRRLVRRRRDPSHGRVLRATVTAKGLEALARCDQAMDTIERDMLRDVSPEAADALGQTLATCAHALEATRPRLPTRMSTDSVSERRTSGSGAGSRD
jgi:DNA-binding MarR family transcriptional regulator